WWLASGVAMAVLLIVASQALRRHPAAPSIAASARPEANGAATQRAARPRENLPPTPVLFQKRPFAVARETAACQWTAEDGRDTNVIRRLAHNDLEYARMVDENARIFRRQLVYHKQTAAAQIERAKLFGETVRRLTLPGLDGQEVEFEITGTDLNPSGL